MPPNLRTHRGPPECQFLPGNANALSPEAEGKNTACSALAKTPTCSRENLQTLALRAVGVRGQETRSWGPHHEQVPTENLIRRKNRLNPSANSPITQAWAQQKQGLHASSSFIPCSHHHLSLLCLWPNVHRIPSNSLRYRVFGPSWGQDAARDGRAYILGEEGENI